MRIDSKFEFNGDARERTCREAAVHAKGGETRRHNTKPLDKLGTAYTQYEKKKIKQIAKAKSLNILAHYHETRGHRSPEWTAMMYELEAGYKLSA